MNKKSAKITNGIACLIMTIGTILGIVYVITGKVFDGKFVGHVDETLTPIGKVPEFLALTGFGVFMVGMIVMSISFLISQKGLSKNEKKEAGKVFSVYFTGILIGFIGTLLLMYLAPKNSERLVTTFKSTTWYYLSLGLNVVAIITMFLGFTKALKSSKAPLIQDVVEEIITKKEPKKDEF